MENRKGSRILKYGHCAWYDANAQKYFWTFYDTDVVPLWVSLSKYDDLPVSLREYSWFGTKNDRTFYDMFVAGPELLVNFYTNTKSLTQYAEMGRIDKRSQTINNTLDDLERKSVALSKSLRG